MNEDSHISPEEDEELREIIERALKESVRDKKTFKRRSFAR